MEREGESGVPAPLPAPGAPPTEAFPQQLSELTQLLSRIVATLDSMRPSLAPQPNIQPPTSWAPACPPMQAGVHHFLCRLLP